MICLATVSASETNELNETVSHENDMEINDDSADDEKEILTQSTQEDILGGDISYTVIGGASNVKVNTPVYFKIGQEKSNNVYDYSLPVYIKVNDGAMEQIGTYREAISSTGVSYTFTSVGTFTVKLAHYAGDYYFTDPFTVTVSEEGGSGGEDTTEPTTIMKLRDKNSGNYSIIYLNQGSTVIIEANAPTDYYYNLQLSSSEDFANYETKKDSMTLGSSWGGISSVTFTESGTYYLRLYNTGDRNGKYSNVLTYIVESSSAPVNPTASVIIKDNNYPNNSTIYFGEGYTSALYYTLTKTGSISGESFEVFLDGNSIGTFDVDSNGKITDVSLDNGNHNLYVVYKANDGDISETSNTINYVYVTPQVTPTASITISDNNYPTNTTIYFDGKEYTVDLYYSLTKTGTFSDESLEVFVDGNSKGSFDLSSDKITSLLIDNSTNHNIYVVYNAKVNGESIQKQSNLLTFIPVTVNGDLGAKLEIRDSKSGKTGTVIVTTDTDYLINIDYYLVRESDSVSMQAVYLYVNDSYVEGSEISNLAYNTYSSFGNSFKVNETGTYIVKLKYEYNSGLLNMEHYEIYSNELVYIITIDDSQTPAEKETPQMSSKVTVNDNTATFNIDIDNDATNTVTVTLNNGLSKTKSVSQGSAIIEFSDLAAGDYTYTLTYSGDDKYKSDTAIGSFKIEDTSIVDQGKIKTRIVVSSNSISKGGEITISLIDVDGNKVFNQILSLVLDGVSENKALNNGIISLNGLSVGNHTLYASFKGDEEYLSADLNTTITVISLVNDEELANIYNGDNLALTFYDENGNPLNNTEVIFTINGNDYPVVTDNNGIASLNIDLVAGTYDVYITHPITREVFSTTVNIVYKLKASNVNVDYSYSKKYGVYLYDGNNNPISNANIDVTLNKVKYSIKTNKNGYATLNVKNLLPGTYSITAEYKGAKISNKIVVKQILKASNKKYKRYKVKKYTATLKTSAGKAIKNKKITFKIKGKTYTAKTNKKGVATIKIKGLYKVGKHTITIKYLKTSIKKTVTVKR